MLFDFAKIEGFDWDEGNVTKSAIKHGVLRREIEQVFFGHPLSVVPDIANSSIEPRFHAFGQSSEGRRLQVTFTLRAGGTLVRVISARDMSRQEKARNETSSQEG